MSSTPGVYCTTLVDARVLSKKYYDSYAIGLVGPNSLLCIRAILGPIVLIGTWHSTYTDQAAVLPPLGNCGISRKPT